MPITDSTLNEAPDAQRHCVACPSAAAPAHVKSHDPNLDMLRALAILAVLAHHIVGLWPTPIVHLDFARLGKYGVTLFFVLSGWLIGTIYWRERGGDTKIRILNFWTRRWLRTIPPYIVAMCLAYASVRVMRSAPFDSAYLCFGQNYETVIPFFMVSWSLCVEEHFYLALPLIGAALLALPLKLQGLTLWTLPLVPPLLRAIDPQASSDAPFGYSHTATHLVFEGLALGVAAAFTRRHYPEIWRRMQNLSRYLVWPAVGAFASLYWWTPTEEYYIGQTLVAVTCFLALAAVAGKKPVPFACSKVTYAIAISSYSIYLTHSLALHAAARTPPMRGALGGFSMLLVRVAFIGVSAASFYFAIERTSIGLRNRVSHWMEVRRSPRVGRAT